METAIMTRAELARIIDHTLLEPEATQTDIARHCREAGLLGVHAVCISPSRLPLAPGLLAPGIAVDSVVGFPSGAHLPQVKAAEAAAAVAAGANEVDMMIDLANALEDRWAPVTAEVAAVRAAIGPAVLLKVILETAVIGLARIEPACHAAETGRRRFRQDLHRIPPGRRRLRGGGAGDGRRGRRAPGGKGLGRHSYRGIGAGDGRGRCHQDRRVGHRENPGRAAPARRSD